jgi:hypothetical protein
MFRLIFAVSAFLMAVSYAHMCMVNPYQRGGVVDVDTWDNADCGYTEAPCGGQGSDERVRYFIVEDALWYFVMVKNVQHYNAGSPGNFTINLLDNDENFVATIGSTKDTSDPEGTLYQISATTPTGLTSGDSYAIQGIYYSNNASLTFYQCADIVVLG